LFGEPSSAECCENGLAPQVAWFVSFGRRHPGSAGAPLDISLSMTIWSDFEDDTSHPSVINGFSDLIVEVLSDAGRHSRVAMGASSLPNGMTVEVESIVHIL
jgi:hypothetical protein